MATANSFQLGILPERKLDPRTLVTSYGLLLLLLVILINVGLIWPDRLLLKQNYHITELIPLPSNQPAPIKLKKMLKLEAKLLPKAPVFASPKLTVPHEIRAPREREREIEPPKVVVNNFQPATLVQSTGGARPVKLIHTGEFGSSAPPTVNAPIQKVQTGGFGDPNGLPGTGKENPKLLTAKLGAFESPQGAGVGNGTGGANGIRGTVASAGFGSGIAQPGRGDGRSNGKAVSTGGFGTQELAKAGGPPKLLDTAAATSSVQITYKPNPVYTDEARQLKLQGEVLLEIMFGSNGQLRVNRVVRGLGHGLDEAATIAANKIKFKPALRDGTAVDSTAVVHVVFQLAY